MKIIKVYDNFITNIHMWIYTENDHIYIQKEDYEQKVQTKVDFGEIEPLNMEKATTWMKNNM